LIQDEPDSKVGRLKDNQAMLSNAVSIRGNGFETIFVEEVLEVRAELLEELLALFRHVSKASSCLGQFPSPVSQPMLLRSDPSAPQLPVWEAYGFTQAFPINL
jgi:hypothetical protein